jgi:hypothetical protein
MKRQTATIESLYKKTRISHYKVVGKQRKRLNETARASGVDHCASCKMDDVIRTMGSENLF